MKGKKFSAAEKHFEKKRVQGEQIINKGEVINNKQKISNHTNRSSLEAN